MPSNFTLQALIDELIRLRDQQKLHPLTEVKINYAHAIEGVIRISETRGHVVLVTSHQCYSGNAFETAANTAP